MHGEDESVVRAVSVRGLAPFAMIPLWLLDGRVSPRAIHVWGVLAAKWANRDTGECWPRRSNIAKAVGCSSVRTIDAALIELEDAGALVRTRRWDDAGSPMSTLYELIWLEPSGGGDTGVAGEGRTHSGTPLAESRERGRADSAGTPLAESCARTRTIENQSQFEPDAAPPSASPRGMNTMIPGKSARATARAARAEKESPAPLPTTIEAMSFEAVRDAWPGWEGVGAKRAWQQARRSAPDVDLIVGLRVWIARYVDPAEAQFCPNLAKWLKERGWETPVPPAFTKPGVVLAGRSTAVPRTVAAPEWGPDGEPLT